MRRVDEVEGGRLGHTEFSIRKFSSMRYAEYGSARMGRG